MKVKNRDGSVPNPYSDKELLAEWREYFSALLNNDNGLLYELPSPSENDLPISTDPPLREETRKAINAMKTNKAAGLDWAVTAEALQAGGDPMMLHIIHKFCVKVFTTLSPPHQCTTMTFYLCPRKGILL